MGSTTRNNKVPRNAYTCGCTRARLALDKRDHDYGCFYYQGATEPAFRGSSRSWPCDLLREFVPESEFGPRHAVRHGRVTGLSSGLRGFQPYIIVRSFAPLVGQPGAETSSTKWEFLSYYPRLPSTRLILFSRVKPTCLTTV